jgi:O-antigen ligase
VGPGSVGAHCISGRDLRSRCGADRTSQRFDRASSGRHTPRCGNRLGTTSTTGALTVDQSITLDAVLIWTTNLAAFALACEFSAESRTHFLDAVLVFGCVVSVLALLTVFSSPPGEIVWWFQTGTGLPTLGPFVYRNQYAAFVEAILPLAILRAILDQRRALLWIVVSAVLFASVVAAASRTGVTLCLAEVLLIPLIALRQGRVARSTLARVMLGCLSAVVLLTAVAGWESVWKRLQEPDPYAQRAQFLRSSLAMVRDRPFTGFGLGTWSEAYPGYALFDDGFFANQAHNDWAQWAAEGGIPFFLLMLCVVCLTVRPALRSIWGLGVLVVFLHCLVDYPMQQRPALAAFFFTLVGCTSADRTRRLPTPLG